MNPTLAIVGRPNVGKSALMNRLTTGEKAIVHATAGTTRDTRRVPGKLFGHPFWLLDTAGIEEGKTDKKPPKETRNAPPALASQLNNLAFEAIAKADVLLFVVDGSTGLSPADRALAQRLRKTGKPIILILNKSDLAVAESFIPEMETLGFGTPVLMSAAHNRGLEDLHTVLLPHLPPAEAEPEEELATPETEEEITEAEEILEPIEEDDVTPTELKPQKIAILGRPNVGKSTLVNALLGEDAMLTGPTAGLTREAITHRFFHKKEDGTTQEFHLVDTPGLRKRNKIVEELEDLSSGQSLLAATKADLVILVVDTSTYSVEKGTWQVFEQQDAKIAATILAKHKPIVVALNKWDTVTEKAECLKEIKAQLAERLHGIREPLAVPLSAMKGKGLEALLSGVYNVLIGYNRRIGTAKLNRTLAGALARRSPPLSGHLPVNLKYITQTSSRPPTFTVFGNRVANLPEHYQQYLRNHIADALDLKPIPIRMVFKKNKNPYQR